MYQGQTLQDVAAELQRQLDTKADFIVDTRELAMVTDRVADEWFPSVMEVADIDRFTVSNYCHGQIASRLQVPKQFYDRLRENHKPLLDMTVNTLMYDKPERRMLRTMDGNARAFLSDRYRRIDNWDLMEHVLPLLAEVPDMQIVSCDVTERNLYVKALFPRITAEVKLNDPVQSGIVIKNSEVGAGALTISPLVFRLVCLNGMISTEGVSKYHLGRRQEEDSAQRFFSDETLAAEDTALWMKVRDVVKATLDETKFNAICIRLRESTERKLDVGPIEAIERLSNKVTVTQTESDSILKHLIEGGDLSQYGLIQAVTRTSQDADDYDRATELEEMGGQLLDADKQFLTAIGIAT
jgi:hypothetical protein